MRKRDTVRAQWDFSPFHSAQLAPLLCAYLLHLLAKRSVCVCEVFLFLCVTVVLCVLCCIWTPCLQPLRSVCDYKAPHRPPNRMKDTILHQAHLKHQGGSQRERERRSEREIEKERGRERERVRERLWLFVCLSLHLKACVLTKPGDR